MIGKAIERGKWDVWNNDDASITSINEWPGRVMPKRISVSYARLR
jgi:hypothetical protein